MRSFPPIHGACRRNRSHSDIICRAMPTVLRARRRGCARRSFVSTSRRWERQHWARRVSRSTGSGLPNCSASTPRSRIPTTPIKSRRSTAARIADITMQYAQTEPWIWLAEGEQTGVSSIMPQKRNPTGLVRLRAEASTLIGEATTFAFIAHNVEPGMSDYKDFGNPKEYPNIILRDMAALFAHADAVIRTMRFRPDRALDEVNSDYSTTTELADTLQREADVPFRIGHHFASELVNYGRGHHLRASEIPYLEAQRIYAEIATAAQMATRLSLSEEQFRRALTAENMVAASQGLGATRTKLADAAQRLDQTFMRLH